MANFCSPLNKDEYITISPSSEAFRYGQGFFTTTLINQGVPLWIEEHINRLNYSLQAFDFPQVDHAKVKEESIKWAKLNQNQANLLRLLVWPTKEGSNYYISGDMVAPQLKPLHLTKASFKRHSSEIIYQYKSFNYWQNLLAYEEAYKKGYGDAIILNERGEICETSRYNIFWIKENTIYTPHLDCNLLNGIMRQKVISLASFLDINLKEVKAGEEELKKAEVVFVTNSVRGIIPVEEAFLQKYKVEDELITGLVNQLKGEINQYIIKNTPEKD